MRATIYIALQAEGVAVWRPVPAELLHDEVYRIIGVPEADEVWEFLPGEAVRCQQRRVGDGQRALVAFERAAD